MFKVHNASAKIHGRFVVGTATGPTTVVGKYFWAPSSDSNRDKWWNLQSWWYDVNHTVQATQLPQSSTDVIVLGDVPPYADIDRNDWIQPHTINAGTAGVEFKSLLNHTITIDISGNATFSGNATYNK